MTRSHLFARIAAPASLRFVGLALALGAVVTAAPQALAHGETQVRNAAASADLALQLRKGHSLPGSVGYASYYARKFIGRLMADGTPMRADSDNAASLTLPLGSKALVTNLNNGRTALVTIRDRGPYIKGRIIDLSPSTAKMLGMLHAGVVRVAVVPLDALPPQEKREAIIAAADSGMFELLASDDGE